MTNTSGERTFAPDRRAALVGLVGGAGAAVLAGCTLPGADPADPPRPGGARSPQAPSDNPTPGVMTLFDDPEFNFNGLLALGGSGARSAEVGEVLTAVNANQQGGPVLPDVCRDLPQARRPAAPAAPGQQARRPDQALSCAAAAQYYGQALFFVLGSDDPGSEQDLYQAGRDAWDTFCDLCDPPPVKAKVPYGRTPLPVWFFRPDRSDDCRPTVILTNGSDGQNIDMWTYGVAAALDRGWNALVHDGPGQGQLLFVDQVVFTPTWEKVVTPLVDWLMARDDVARDKIALTGLSMGGDLAPRAAAFEDRIAALVAMPGCVARCPRWCSTTRPSSSIRASPARCTRP